MMRLTRAVLATVMFVFVGVNAASAQDFTDEDIRDYAVILMAQKSITDKITPAVEEYIAKQEGIDNNKFAELDAIANGDATKLPNGTPEEKFQRTFYKTMQDRVVAKKKKAAQTVVSQLATHGLGAKKYNAIKKAYKSDSSIKAKVDGLMSSMTAE